MTLIDWIGTLGVTMILVAYLLSVFKVLQSGNFLYILLNLFGAGMACLASVMIEYLPFIILEGTWTFVSLIALIKLIRKKYVR